MFPCVLHVCVRACVCNDCRQTGSPTEGSLSFAQPERCPETAGQVSVQGTATLTVEQKKAETPDFECFGPEMSEDSTSLLQARLFHVLLLLPLAESSGVFWEFPSKNRNEMWRSTLDGGLSFGGRANI